MKDDVEKLRTLETRYGVRIFYFSETTSTNDLARDERFRQGDVIVAERQTAGRGQRGNRWSSEAGTNLTFTMVLEPKELEAENQFYVSRAVTLAVTDMLARFGIGASVKWPNDIYVDDRKICGILIEHDLMGSNVVRSIAGIGINVNQHEFDPLLPNPVSMASVKGMLFDRTEVLGKFLEAVRQRTEHLDGEEYSSLDRDYRKILYRADGKEYFFREPEGTPFRAVLETVLPGGEMVLRKSDGARKSYWFKEVEFVL